VNSYFDVFVRIDNEKFIKILKSGDCLPPERVFHYIQKGSAHFYIKQMAQLRCLAYCRAISENTFKNSTVPKTMKLAQVMGIGQDMMEVIKKTGMTQAQVAKAESFLFKLKGSLLEADTEDQKTIEVFLSQAGSSEHAIATTLVASLMTGALKIESAMAYRQVGLAALLHDVGLYGNSQAVRNEDVSQMDTLEREQFYQHPLFSAQILRNMALIDETTIQAVEQHHERHDNTGFPKKIAPDRIHRIAEIVGISDEFIRIIQHPNYDSKLGYEKIMQEQVFKGFSEPVVESFQKVFFKKADSKKRVA
jgi:response regulator RpfG family c-di-GMP phosphodiesterase